MIKVSFALFELQIKISRLTDTQPKDTAGAPRKLCADVCADDLVQDLVQALVQDLVQDQTHDMFLRKIKELDLKWVHMAPYGRILRLDGAILLRIISKLLTTHQNPLERPKMKEKKRKS